MPIIGHGIDLVEVARIARMHADHGPHFLDRCFTPAEQAYCLDHKRPDPHLAGRFAAKESNEPAPACADRSSGNSLS